MAFFKVENWAKDSFLNYRRKENETNEEVYTFVTNNFTFTPENEN